MRTIDHKILANYLACSMNEHTPQLYKQAFIMGNTEPDWNVLTYFHGFFKGQKMHGHNYENVWPVIEKMYHTLQNKKQWHLTEYYQFGKLMHYVTDMFTYPHNGIFKGSLGEHCAYEEKLHETFLSALQKHDFADGPIEAIENLQDLQILHDAYIENVGECLWDCTFIFQATKLMLGLEAKADNYDQVRLPEIREA